MFWSNKGKLSGEQINREENGSSDIDLKTEEKNLFCWHALKEESSGLIKFITPKYSSDQNQ